MSRTVAFSWMLGVVLMVPAAALAGKGHDRQANADNSAHQSNQANQQHQQASQQHPQVIQPVSQPTKTAEKSEADSAKKPAVTEAAKPKDGVAEKPKDSSADKPKDGVAQKAKAAEVDLIEVEKQILEQTNAQRVKYGLPPLAADNSLEQTARSHAVWMTTNRTLQHTSRPVGENIAMGQNSTGEAVTDWMNSSGHRANILSPSYHRTGVAAYKTPDGTIYWCQQFLP